MVMILPPTNSPIDPPISPEAENSLQDKIHGDDYNLSAINLHKIITKYDNKKCN